MKYEIIPQDDTVQIEITENGSTECLTLMEAPPKNCMLVQNSRKDVLGEINLEKLLANLDDCIDLLQITFNATDGFTVQANVQDLITQFSNAMVVSNSAAYSFKDAAKTIVDAYIEAYGYLFYGQIDIAIMIFKDAKDVAAEMVKESDKLVKIFDDLTTKTDEILHEVITERAVDEEKRSETQALVGQLKASVNALTQLKENYAKDLQQIQEDYENLQQREMTMEKRSYNMQLASLIMSGIGSMFGKGTASSGKFNDESEILTESETNGDSAKTTAKSEYVKNIGEQEKIKAQIKQNDERIKAIDKILDGKLYKDGENNGNAEQGDADTKKTAKELKEEKVSLTEENKKLNEKLNSLQGSEKVLSETLQGFGEAMDKISSETRSAAQEIQKKADNLAQRMKELNKRRNELKDKERENIAQLAAYTEKMENAVITENELESAIQSLVIAIGCLRRVLACLQEIKLFWSNVEKFCCSLEKDDGRILSLVEVQKNKDSDQCAVYFKHPLFVKRFVETIAKWEALYVIFEEYYEDLAKSARRLSETLMQQLDSERSVQWKLASELAGKLNKKLKSEVAESDGTV
ncbi:MAG: hypothetical protein ACI4HI_18755 [Lachnospiraceae bacterium]